MLFNNSLRAFHSRMSRAQGLGYAQNPQYQSLARVKINPNSYCLCSREETVFLS